MDWIKVTPETMPTDNELVFVTCKNRYGKRYVLHDIVYSAEYSCWKWGKEEYGNDYWPTLTDDVTHWMPYPGPAED